ncbi:MAG: TetR family transcriptional regulator [Anaerolineales bacterium]|nr:TetR family transcriptional regulator [Anaerolineales bacterium]
MRRTKEEALVTRENVLSAALLVFSQYGYSAARLEDIAKVAEVTRGAIYHHFGSKEELYKTLVTERSAGINQLAEEILAQAGTPLEILRRFLVRLFEYAEEDEEYRALLELTVSKVELTEGLETIMKDTVKGRRQLAAYFQELLRQGIQAGEIRSDLPVKPAANALISFMNGVGLIWIQDPRAFSIREDAEALVDVFLKGIER